VAGLSSLGLPGTAGFVAEFLVFAGGWQSPHPWWSVCGVLGAFVTAVYVLRVSRAVFFGAGPSDHFHDLRDARRVEWAPLWILGGTLILVWWVEMIRKHCRFRLWPHIHKVHRMVQ